MASAPTDYAKTILADPDLLENNGHITVEEFLRKQCDSEVKYERLFWMTKDLFHHII